MILSLFALVLVGELAILQKLYGWTWRRPQAVVTALTPEVESAVRSAMRQVGLNEAALTGDADLQATGKLQEILHHASTALGIDHRLRTVTDVVAYLESKR